MRPSAKIDSPDISGYDGGQIIIPPNHWVPDIPAPSELLGPPAVAHVDGDVVADGEVKGVLGEVGTGRAGCDVVLGAPWSCK